MNLRSCQVEQTCDTAGFEHRRVSVRETLGGELIGCQLYEFDPGAQLWPYHLHWNNEEWLVVVAGAPTLRTPEGEQTLREGDVVGFPQGEPGAHTLYNRTDDPVRVAIFSTLRPGTVVYPDSGKVSTIAGVFRLRDAVDYWDGE